LTPQRNRLLTRLVKLRTSLLDNVHNHRVEHRNEILSLYLNQFVQVSPTEIRFLEHQNLRINENPLDVIERRNPSDRIPGVFQDFVWTRETDIADRE
jgi:hypothetical protein